MIFPEDHKRCQAFADPDMMIERIRQTLDGILRDYFRVLRPGQDHYVWKEFDLLLVPGSEERKVLSGIKNAEPSADEEFLRKELGKCSGSEERGG